MDVLLTLLPIIVVLVLLAFIKWPADASGLAGWITAVAVAYFFFNTRLEVSMTSSLYGLLLSFPISLMVATSIFQITFLESTGALQRIVVFVKTLAKSDRAVQIMILNMGIGTLLVSVGATPVSILPPIMLALGYSTFVAVALPALGFDSLCTYALLGAPLVAFVDLTAPAMSDAALANASLIFSSYMPVISTLIGFAMLYIVGGFKQIKEGFIPCTIAGLTMGLTAMAVAHIGRGIVLTGVFAGLATVLIMFAYLWIQRKPLVDRSCLIEADLKVEQEMSLLRALAPWLILIASCLFVNFYPPVLTYLRDTMGMPVHVIPNIAVEGAKPVKPVALRMLWNAYTWVLISTLLAIPFLRPTGAQWKEIFVKWFKRAPRPVFSAAIFFAIAFVMNFSGFEVVTNGWVPHPDSNMIAILATQSADFFKGLYPAIAAYLGLLGGFVTGSEASTIALFTKYNILISEKLHLNYLVVIAGTAIAGGLASVISPAKLQNAAATIDALGIESKVIRVAFIISFILTTVAAVMTFFMAT
ncbi:MAG: L-lactate permease [Solirubrobacterales bacterium]